MTRLKAEREKRGLSRAALARAASVGEGIYGQIENRRRVPYDPEIERIAAALEWRGDPRRLLEDAPQDD